MHTKIAKFLVLPLSLLAATACAVEDDAQMPTLEERAEIAGATDLATVGPDLEAQAKTERPTCGGFAGLSCPEGMRCKDYPGDGCSPNRGGADCIGVCVGKQDRCNFNNDPDKSYIGTSSEQCAVIHFFCAEGTEYFADDCGCGCQVSSAI